jgi:spore germination protein YaaH
VLAGALVSVAALPISPSAAKTVPQHVNADESRPRIMQAVSDLSAGPSTGGPALLAQSPRAAVRPLVANPSRPQREVFGFVNSVNLGDPNVGYTTWDFNLLTTVAFFGLHVNSGDGNLVTINDTAWNVYHSATMTNFVNAAHAKGVRVIVSINLHDFAYNATGQMCTSLLPANAQHTIDQTVAQVAWAGIDGINVNYEGTDQYCQMPAGAPGITDRDLLTTFVKNLRAAMPSGSYLSIDTYTGSAEDNLEFFDITGLAPSVDAFFVMAYDMDYANAAEVPLSCATFCFNPISPLNTYRFNVTASMTQYTNLVASSKVILGQPYFSRGGCVPNATDPHQIPTRPESTGVYTWASRLIYQAGVSNASGHRDPGDGVSEWDIWWDAGWNCIAEQYYDDVISLSAKYDVVNRYKLGGVGLFTLDYGGGSPELWGALSTYFSCPVTFTLPATTTTTEFTVPLSAGSCSVAYFDLQQYDTRLSQGWFDLNPVTAAGGAGSGLAEGFPGTTYSFRARAHTTGGLVTSWATATTMVATTAALTHPFKGVYVLDSSGGVHPVASPPLSGSAYWPGWSIAHVAHPLPDANSPQSGAVLDGFGGLHPYGSTFTVATSAYWQGWQIARDFAFMPDGSGGFVLDGFGGLHPFHINGSTAPLQAQGNAYWQGSDLARKVVILPDGTGGYTLDAYGGVHPFGINGPIPATIATVAGGAYWPGWDIARDLVLVPGNGNHSGYVLDGFGGLHPFHPTTDGSAMPAAVTTTYWQGNDIARSAWFVTGSATDGYTLDSSGSLHPFGAAPALTGAPSWPGQDLAKSVWGA